jgi:pimeloyl-ACP methyl ester carboxylesterase
MTPVEHSRKLAAAMPHCQYVEIAGGAHLTLMDHADEVNALLRVFLQRAAATIPRKGRRRRRDDR